MKNSLNVHKICIYFVQHFSIDTSRLFATVTFIMNFIFGFLQFQCALGCPNTAVAVESTSSFADSQHEKLIALFKFSSEQIYINLYDYLRKIKDIFEQVNSSVITDDDNELIRANVAKLNYYITKIKKISREELENCFIDLKKRYNLRREILKALIKYDNSKIEDSTKDQDELFKIIFKYFGLSQLKYDFMLRLEKFFNKFLTRSDEFWNSLTDEEKVENNKFKIWYQQFKVEKDSEIKLYMFFTLFEMYNFEYSIENVL